ncbi:MAG TPA: tyrosinase family protein [Candidatus Angelobacter sp.]|nr:tyrosinase family protein [Candidatus Angelobacter sp.]
MGSGAKITTTLLRVREILRAAAGGNDNAFGGLPLWEFSRERLLNAKLHGILLIASEKEAHSCCGHAKNAETGIQRGARSGLIRGLRGQPPFDGSQFPQLPWQRTPVGAEDIQEISDWIDAGCPFEDAAVAVYEIEEWKAETSTETIGTHVYPANTSESIAPLAGDINEYKFQHGELRQRMNIDCLTQVQRDKLRFAFRELYELNKWPEDARNYNNQALIHQNHCQHGWERFLPWHRIYLYEFEQALQDRCPGVTIPYWDWTMPQYQPSHPDKGMIIPRALQAFLTKASLKYLEQNGIPATGLEPMLDRTYPSQKCFFDKVSALIGAQYIQGEYRERFIDALLEANSLWYPLRYPGEFGSGTINTVIHYHYPTAEDIEEILCLRTFRDFGGGSLYNDSFGFIDQNPHNTMHIWTGGMNPQFNSKAVPADRNQGVQVAGRKFHKREDLYTQPQFGDMFSNLTASYDPVFWPVHSNVDRLWWEWEQRHPDSLPADPDSVLTPWSYTIRDTLDMYRFGYEYVRSAHIVPVGVEAPVGKFVSQPIDVSGDVRSSFQRAEVRLHRVPQLPRSCFIRVFLNLPDANANTPLEDEHYAGYLAVFGHGDCYGGPGHCAVPPSRKFDLRPRSHNSPRNHRVNVTKCAKALIAKGATSFQITLVVLGVDYAEDIELLRLEGVSLNFLD